MKISQHIRLSLRSKIALTATLGVVFVTSLLLYFSSRQMEHTADVALDQRGAAIIRGLANECEYGLMVGNKSLLQQAAVKTLAQADVVSAVVFDDHGRVMAAAGKFDVMTKQREGPELVARYSEGEPVELPDRQNRAVEMFYLSVYLQPSSVPASVETDDPSASSAAAGVQKLGLVELTISYAATNLAVQNARATAVGLAAVCALVVSLLCVGLVRRMVRPLRELVEGTEELAAGNLAARVAAKTSDEIGELGKAFNKMAGALQQSRGEILDNQRHLEQRVAERTAALQQAEEKYRSIFENAVVGIFQTAIDGRYLTANPTLARIFGYGSPEELTEVVTDLNRRFYADPERRKEFIRLVEQNGTVSGFESQAYCKDGSVIWISEDARAVRDRNGVLIGFEGTAIDITERKRAEENLNEAHRQLLETSRQAGMAEVATSVLHNVGNVLNSVNVSTTLVSEKVKKLQVSNLAKAAALLQEHAHDLAGFLAADPKGSQLPAYLGMLSEHLGKDQATILAELEALTKNVDHIKDIVSMQQSYSRVAGIVETLPVVEVVEDAVRLNAASFDRHGVKVVREYQDTPPVSMQRHKVLQILVNLLRNAKYAMDDSKQPEHLLTLRVGRDGNNTVKVSVIDNGVGIPPENLTRIFERGFTTRKDGHGFALHNGALAAREMGGVLTVHSDGPGKGAAFTLELPLTEENATP